MNLIVIPAPPLYTCKFCGSRRYNAGSTAQHQIWCDKNPERRVHYSNLNRKEKK